MSGGPASAGGETVRQTMRRLRWVIWVTSVAGTIVVFNSIGFLIPIFLDKGESGRLAIVNGIAIVAVGDAPGREFLRGRAAATRVAAPVA